MTADRLTYTVYYIICVGCINGTIFQECSKDVLILGYGEESHRILSISVEILSITLRCLAPFMPYLAEELYQRLPSLSKSESVVISPFPLPEQVIIIL